MEWNNILITCITIVFTCIATVIINFVTLKIELTKLKKESVYLIKKEAILDSLRIIDLYLSWLNYDSGVVPIREDIASLDLTKKVRECYNNLCVSCDNNELIQLFLDIIFCKDKDPMELYVNYRNKVRQELGLKDITMDEKRVFVSKVSTKDLEKN